jgi:hypothetical protein
MDKLWLKPDLLFLPSSLDQGMSFAEVAGFLCRNEDAVRKKAEELGLRECAVWPVVRPKVEEAPSLIQETGTASALKECRLLLARINDTLSGIQPEQFVNSSPPIVQGALEYAAAVLKKMSSGGDRGCSGN